jgi:hypothetical protein
MFRNHVSLVAILALSLAASVAQTGGRAHVSVLNVPKEIVAGKPLAITIAVRPEWPMAKNRNLEPIVHATLGEREVKSIAVPLKTSGRYKATLTLPAAGDWRISVDSRYCETKMNPLVLKAEEVNQKTS